MYFSPLSMHVFMKKRGLLLNKILKSLKKTKISLMYLIKYTQEKCEKSSIKVSAYLSPKNE
jgi:hypothetical protein